MGRTRRALPPLLAVLAGLAACDTLFPMAPADGGDGDADSDVDVDVDGDSDGDGGDLLCNNECRYNFSDTCDDGGRSATSDWCEYGTDCADCGARDPGCVPYCGDPGATWECGWDECGGSCGWCSEGSYCLRVSHECVPCSCAGLDCGVSYCGNWCGDCAVGQICDWALGTCQACTCAQPSYECGYDNAGCLCGVCETGFCDNTTHTCDTAATELCNNACEWAGDGICDDHGRGCDYAACPFGWDCLDCGVRTEGDRLHPDAPCPG